MPELGEPRVLVCGSRRWPWTHAVETVLDRLIARYGQDLVVIEGGRQTRDRFDERPVRPRVPVSGLVPGRPPGRSGNGSGVAGRHSSWTGCEGDRHAGRRRDARPTHRTKGLSGAEYSSDEFTHFPDRPADHDTADRRPGRQTAHAARAWLGCLRGSVRVRGRGLPGRS
ncbi:SLOG family protein [Streptomyces murinus]|uniref:SLOG family protein n=1 Tax=Streptomyces murinus TaxID=33900 RepID=UPI0035562F18